MKNYVVKNRWDKYDEAGPCWTIDQKKATRYTRTQAYTRAEALPYWKARVVKLVPKKVAPDAFWVIRRRHPIQYRSRAEAILNAADMRDGLDAWKVVKVRP
jgi:hypothetical protein